MIYYGRREGSDVLVALIPKSGLQTVTEALRTHLHVSLNESCEFETRIAFLRDPMDRFMSGYSMFYWLTQMEKNRTSPPTSSYEAYVDWALENTDDLHVMPYTHMFPNLTRAYRLVDVAGVWPKYFDGGNLPGHINRFVRLEGGDYRNDELMALYDKDAELWRSL